MASDFPDKSVNTSGNISPSTNVCKMYIVNKFIYIFLNFMKHFDFYFNILRNKIYLKLIFACK